MKHTLYMCDLGVCVHFFFGFVFETRSHYVVLEGLEFTMQTNLVSNSQRSTCSLLNAEMKGVYHDELQLFILEIGFCHS